MTILELILTVVAVVLFGITCYLLWLIYNVQSINQQLEQINQETTNSQITLKSQSFLLKILAQNINQLIIAQQQTNQHYLTSKLQLDLAIHNIAHDLRTPLTISSGYAQVLLKQTTANSINQRPVQQLNKNLTILSKHLDLLLLYNRIIENRIQIQIVPIDVSEQLQQQCLSFYDAFQKQKISLHLEISPHIIWSLDEEAFRRIIQNIMANIIEHGTQDATIRLHHEQSRLVLDVTNSLAAPIEHPQKLLDRFYTEDLSRKSQNAGLGLYIVTELAKRMHAKVTIETHDLTFSIKLIW
ncbi:MAG: sensor histidine kinase [Lactobacillus sp.]|nr:MAG: sensor histidine kinase [Lactobacillus sp.]